jgi:transcriptional regulator of acetoin/glycerol metabolism
MIRTRRNEDERIPPLLGIPKTNVDRLFDFRNRTPLDQIEQACAALGKRLAVAVKDAAWSERQYRDAPRTIIEKLWDNEEANWNVSGAARALGMERTNLHKRIRALGLSRGK